MDELSYPKTSRPFIYWGHIDGPYLHMRHGKIHWLSWWEKFLVLCKFSDAYDLERKHWNG